MGLGSAFIDDLSELKARGAVDGFSSVIEIGAQQLSSPMLRHSEATDGLLCQFGRAPRSFGAAGHQDASGGVELLPDAAPSSRDFWESLGFRYSALDFDGHRDSIAIDLNRDAVPRRLKGAFDLVVNTGTTEHVANQDNAFRVIHDLTRSGGVMMHELPAQGMMTHGLINYNPKFFWHLCRENNYEVLYLRVVSHACNDVPADVLATNMDFSGHQHITIKAIPDFMIRAALRKVHDVPFVTPLDLPDGFKSQKPAGLLDRIAGYRTRRARRNP